MSGCRAKKALLFGVVLVLAMAHSARAQLIPLLPPMAGDAPEDSAAPQQGGSAQLVKADLDAGKYDDLDEWAQRLRTKKSRVAGGGWKLRTFYTQLNPREATDQAEQAHIAQLKAWIAAKPESITARVSLAESLETWAWMSRGGGTADTVTPTMAAGFFVRIAAAKKVLDEAKKLPVMCPQWYSEMMTVGLAEGWERDKMQALFDEGTKFEPGYLYLYREYANYLLPKWEGRAGDAPEFAKTVADRLGGDDGDLVYWEVATVVVKRGNGGIPLARMDWDRIKRGARVLDTRYGQSRTTTNQLAFMAYKYQDAAVAGPLFATIGERWAPAVWKTQANYEQAKRWAVRAASQPLSGTADGTGSAVAPK